MYGTVARLRVKPDRWDDLLAVYDEWERDRKPRTEGAVGGYLYRLDADRDTAILCAIFRDKPSYTANADDPEQDKWYQRFRECLASDPEWMDGEVVRAV